MSLGLFVFDGVFCCSDLLRTALGLFPTCLGKDLFMFYNTWQCQIAAYP